MYTSYNMCNTFATFYCVQVDVTAQDMTGKTALHYCAENGQSELAGRLIEADPSLLEVKDFDGYSPLQLAVISGNGLMAEYLIKSGADVHSRDNEEHTLAHWATGKELACIKKIPNELSSSLTFVFIRQSDTYMCW